MPISRLRPSTRTFSRTRLPPRWSKCRKSRKKSRTPERSHGNPLENKRDSLRAGGLGVASSNLAAPTKEIKDLADYFAIFRTRSPQNGVLGRPGGDQKGRRGKMADDKSVTPPEQVAATESVP